MNGGRFVAHARGIYQELDAPHGWIVFKVFNCMGRKISRNEVPVDLAGEDLWDRVEAWLNTQCPLGHEGPCPSAEPEPRPVFDARRIHVPSRADVAFSPPQSLRLLSAESST